jgi:FlaA1/EpsC-like NDP-sugar epimerase
MGITGVELTPVAYDRSRHQTIEYQKIALLAALILGDALVVATSFVLAYIVRFFTNLPIFVEGAMQPEFYAPFIAILVPSWIALFALHGLYQHTALFNGTQEYHQIFDASSKGMLLVVTLTFFIPDIVIARGWLIMSWFLSFSLTMLWRF